MVLFLVLAAWRDGSADRHAPLASRGKKSRGDTPGKGRRHPTVPSLLYCTLSYLTAAFHTPTTSCPLCLLLHRSVAYTGYLLLGPRHRSCNIQRCCGTQVSRSNICQNLRKHSTSGTIPLCRRADCGFHPAEQATRSSARTGNSAANTKALQRLSGTSVS